MHIQFLTRDNEGDRRKCSGTFDSFKKDVTELFLEDICKEFVTAYEFVKIDEHKSHLLMNVVDMEKLEAAMTSPICVELDKRITVMIPFLRLSFLNKTSIADLFLFSTPLLKSNSTLPLCLGD